MSSRTGTRALHSYSGTLTLQSSAELVPPSWPIRHSYGVSIEHGTQLYKTLDTVVTIDIALSSVVLEETTAELRSEWRIAVEFFSTATNSAE